MTDLVKNILYIGGFELPDKNAAAQRVIANAKLLRDLGYNVVLFGTDKSYQANDLKNSYKSINDFDTYSIPYPKTIKHWVKYVTSINNTLELIKLTNIKFDFIITYNFPALSSMKILKYCKNNKINTISDCTEWYNHKPNNIMGIIKFLDSELRIRYFNKKYDGLICISRYLFDYYKDVNNKIQLPPLVDLEDEKWKVKILPKRDKSILVYAGSPGGKDKINLLIDSMIKIDKISKLIEFRVFGISKEEYYLKYNYHKIIENSIDEFVLFLGKIPHKKVIEEITNADFSAFIRENTRVNNAGFPTKFVESISCGTPVITNRTSNLDDYLINYKNGFFLEDNSYQGLEKIIQKNIKQVDNSIFSYKIHIGEFKQLLNNIYNQTKS
ncbi:MAG: glycosyltransferase [Candidatus Delongbacteria bacterium]|jgi:glycosyltransferase involved in cell wall biosynthesis|nr:glycosyltransferase [Candidatus Delongbacteria bacterium]